MNESAGNPSTENKCPQCGTPLTSGGLAGLCPACLLKQAATETAVPTGVQNFQPPTVEELAKLFPQLEIIALIGRGGMGAVYKARQPMLDRIVALKILPAAVTRGTDFGDRFTREARALAKLNHPNIVMVHEFGQINGQPYFIMEFVDGVNLRQLEREGKLTPREALLIVPQICEALQFAHDAGIVHRDIKPDNILLDKKGRVKIADFGIAKILGTAEDPAIPVTQGAIGTPHYMAPEQVEKPQTVDHRADIFSLGVVFYEMLTGELPLGKFSAPSAGPRGLQVDVRLDEVVFRALEREPNRRYQHASQVKTAVETIAGTTAGASLGTGAASNNFKTETLLARDYQLEVWHCVQRGWALVKSDFWPLVGMTALILVLAEVASATLSQLGSAAKGTSPGFFIVQMLLTGPLVAGLYLYFLKKIRREPATVDTAFAGFRKRFLHLFLANFVMTSLIMLGFLCLILPGIYLLIAWMFALTLVIDKEMDFWPAMELSRKMVNKHWWKALLLVLVMGALLLGGFICCLIGIFIAAPVAFAASMYAYEDIFGVLPPPDPTRPASSVRPLAAAPAAAGFGPAGTMVMPQGGSAGAPPPIGGQPPRATPPPSGGGFWKWPLILVGAAIVTLFFLIALVSLIPDFKFNIGDGDLVHKFGRASVLFQPSARAHRKHGAGDRPHSPAFNAFADRVRSELAKSSVEFDELQLRSTGDNDLLVMFTGLQKISPADTNAAPSGLRVNSDDAVVSISASKGIQITDKKNHDHTTISLPGITIDVNDDSKTNSQTIDGALAGTRLGGSDWSFAGTGDLAAIKFEVTNLDLIKLMPPPPPPAAPGASHEALVERLDAASTITEPDVKDKSLAELAADAADAGELEIAKSALEKMTDTDARDAATHDCAVSLAKNGRRKDAVEMAKLISDSDLRDKVLAELAQ
jgi:tRNA A-37 threonylcarbamoyl transferase component Bud32